jgi:hypothetical protein
MTVPPPVDLSELDPKFAKHLSIVADAIVDGEVVPVLGAGANLCDRGPGDTPEGKWVEGKNLPSGAELALWLAGEFKVDEKNADVPNREDLLRVAQYTNLTRGERSLFKRLDKVFLQEGYEIPSLHRFLAALPKRLAATSEPDGTQPLLILSTNYDDLVERALKDAGVEFHLVRYCANGANQGLFIHKPPGDSEEIVIAKANDYLDLDPDKHTIVLKIHGSVVRTAHKQDSYVITEDHYIEYLTHTNPSELFPAKILAKLVDSNLLFLGYGLRDWNLRVLLYRILAQRAGVDTRSWAVQKGVSELDVTLWSPHKVELQDHGLKEYIEGLDAALEQATA